jgi:hypothetical protein
MKKHKNIYKFKGVTLKAVRDKGVGTGECDQCFFYSYYDCIALKREYGIPSCGNPRVRFIMIKNDTKL